MTRYGPGAMDERVGYSNQLRDDVDYRRPPRGGDALFDIVGDLRGKRILDLGCGLGPYRKVIEGKGATWVGLELDGDGCSVIGDGGRLPFKDESFDGVLCAAVLEHLPEPGETIAEMRRVLVDGGVAFGYVAFLEPFHGMSYFHMSHMGLEYLLLKNGLQPTRIFSPWNGTAYQMESALFPRHVPILQPIFRAISQGIASICLGAQVLARKIVRALRGRPDTDGRYAQFLSLRFGIGINFVAVRTDSTDGHAAGYLGIKRDA